VSFDTFSAIEQTLKTDDKPYIRHIIKRNEKFEIVLIKWNKECLPHDHNDSYGAIKVLRGTGVHKIYKYSDTQNNNHTTLSA